MGANRKYSEEEVESMLSLWRSGLNYPQIAVKINKGTGAVGSVIRRYMTDEDKIRAADLLSNPTRVQASRVDEVMKSWRIGMRYADIAKAHGFNMNQIKTIIEGNRTEEERASKRAHITYSNFHQKHSSAKKGPLSLEALPVETAPAPRIFTGVHFRKCQWISGKATSDDLCKCMAKTGAGRTYCPSHEAKAKRVNYNELQ